MKVRAAYQVRVAGGEKRDCYNRRPDEFDRAMLKGFANTKLDAIRRRYCWQKRALNEAMRKRILSEEIVRAATKD